MNTLGVDPGKHGAMFLLGDDGPIIALEMARIAGRTVLKRKTDDQGKRIKKKLKDTPDWDAIRDDFDMLCERHIDNAFVERVSGGQSFGRAQSGSFNFGETYGFICGLILANHIPLVRVPATVWKGHYGLSDKTDKKGSRTLAMQLLPHPDIRYDRVKDDGIAESGLIAYYGKLTLGEKT